jgi:hypothetical protein
LLPQGFDGYIRIMYYKRNTNVVHNGISREGADAFNFRGHLMIGFLLALLFAQTSLEAVVIVFCSFLPDIDHPTSTFGQFNPLARWGWVQHRGFTHSVLGVFLFSLPFVALGTQGYWMAVIGYAGHVLGDVLLGLRPNKQSLPIRIW